MDGPASGRRGATRDLLSRLRFELLPLAGAAEAATVLPPGATVTVTASPSRGLGATVALAEELSAKGYRVVPHLAARQVTDRDMLAGLLTRLDAAGVRDVFVVGGDATAAAGEFGDGLALLRAMRELGHRMSVGVPSYPEGHPLIDDERLWDVLAAKASYADYTVTQLCFDADAVCAFAGRMRDRGIALPLLAGIPGAVDLARLLRVSLRVGVGESARFLSAHRGVAGALLRPDGYRPDALVRRLAEHAAAGRPAPEGLHVYTFNQVDATLRRLQRVQRRAVS